MVSDERQSPLGGCTLPTSLATHVKGGNPRRKQRGYMKNDVENGALSMRRRNHVGRENWSNSQSYHGK